MAWWRDYRWQLVLVLLFGAVINYVDRVNLGFATEIRSEYGLSPLEWGMLLSAWMWPYAIANLPAGWLIDKFGISKLYVWSLIIWSLSTVLAGLTTNFTELYLTRIVLGIAEAPFFVIAGSLTRRYFSADSRGLASSVVNIGPKIANGFAPPLVAFLIIYFSWRGMFITLGIFGMLIVVLWRLIYLKDDSAWLPADNVATDLIPITHKFSFKELFFNKTIVWFNLGNFGSSYVFWLFFTWIPTYLMDQRGLNLKETGFLTMIPFLAGVIAVPLGGWVSDRLIKNGWNVIKARLVPAVGGCLIAGLASFPINYVDSLSVAIILFTISTFAVSARVGVMWALVGDISPKEIVGTVGGIQNFANFIGGALAPMITGFVLAKTGNYNIVFWISGILVILAAFCYAMIKTPILAKS